jgi:hypothetical protein
MEFREMFKNRLWKPANLRGDWRVELFKAAGKHEDASNSNIIINPTTRPKIHTYSQRNATCG